MYVKIFRIQFWKCGIVVAFDDYEDYEIIIQGYGGYTIVGPTADNTVDTKSMEQL